MRTINRSFAASLFNVFASIALVVIASGVMVWFIRTDPDSAATFAPVYFLVLCIIGGFFFSGRREGEWQTMKPILQLVSGFLIMLAISLYAFYWATTTHERLSRSHRPYVASSLETNRPSIHDFHE